MKFIALTILQFCILIGLMAHGDLDKRIITKTAEIEKSPQVASLYYDRGYLYQQHEEFKNALQDYLKADSLSFTESILPFRKTEVYLELEQYQDGMRSIELCFQYDSTDIKFHKLRGNLFTAMQSYREATLAYTYVIKHTQDLRPENYIQLSDSYMREDSSSLEKALSIIEQGLQDLGKDVFILKQQKLNYLIKLNYSQAVLVMYDDFIQASKRPERWYYQKADYLFQQKELQQAEESLNASKKAFLTLHPRLQRTKAMLRLKNSMWVLEQKIQQETETKNK